MSTFTTTKIHPITGLRTEVLCIDDYFGPREYGYRFAGEKEVYSEKELEAMTPPDNV